LSWFKPFNFLITYVNIIFRMFPGILLTTILFGTSIITSSLVLFIIYGEHFHQFSNVLAALVSIFNFYNIVEIYNDKKISESMIISRIYILYNIVFLVSLVFLFLLTVATYIYMFKKAANIEIAKENNEVMSKLNELDENINKLSDKKEDQLNDSDEHRQTIWLCLTESNELYKELNENKEKEGNNNNGGDNIHNNNKKLLFTTANQIISFLKYLFAIKPKMQFKSLDQKFTIVIELYTDINIKNFLKEGDLEQIDILFDWLNFAGCKIPAIMYSENKLDKYLRMNLNTNYWNVTFLNTKKELNSYLNPSKYSDLRLSDIYTEAKTGLFERQDTIQKDIPVRRKTQTHSSTEQKRITTAFKQKKAIVGDEKHALTVLSEAVDEE
jgi:hypothetical protein